MRRILTGRLLLLRLLLFCVGVACFTAVLSSSAFGQITNVNDTTSTPIPGAGHDYIHMLTETVNPANGSVSVRVCVPMPPGRKLTVPFCFAYDTNGVNTLVAVGNGTAT